MLEICMAQDPRRLPIGEIGHVSTPKRTIQAEDYLVKGFFTNLELEGFTPERICHGDARTEYHCSRMGAREIFLVRGKRRLRTGLCDRGNNSYSPTRKNVGGGPPNSPSLY